jgi:hypothetical protein
MGGPQKRPGQKVSFSVSQGWPTLCANFKTLIRIFSKIAMLAQLGNLVGQSCEFLKISVRDSIKVAHCSSVPCRRGDRGRSSF